MERAGLTTACAARRLSAPGPPLPPPPLPIAPIAAPTVLVRTGQTVVAADARSVEQLPPRLFGAFNLKGYRQGEQIGQGSYGTVHLYRKGDSEVVVKRTHDANHFENALREIEIYKKLLHPNIVSYLGHQYGPQSTLVIERGRCDLSNFIHGTNSAYDQTCVNVWMTGLLKAVDYLHEHDLIHTDVKPGNIMMFRDTQRRFYPKLGDLGCCQYCHRDPAIKMNTYIQTQHYRSPEIQEYHRQGLKQGLFDEKIDIWSVGIILVDLLCHKCTYEYIAYYRPGHFNAIRQYLQQNSYLPLAPDALTLLMSLLTMSLAHNPISRASAATLLQHSYWGSDTSLTRRSSHQSYPKGIPHILREECEYGVGLLEEICDFWQEYYHDLPAQCVRDGFYYAHSLRSRVAFDFFRLVQYGVHVMSLFYLNETPLLKSIYYGRVEDLYELLNKTDFVIF